MPPKFAFSPSLDNYRALFAQAGIVKQVANSVFRSLGAVVLAVTVSFLAAFCFSRFRPRGTDVLMFLLLSIRMLPGPAVILPVFLMYVAFG